MFITVYYASMILQCLKNCFIYFSDEDMMSMASLLSTNNSDIAPLDDFEDVEGNFIILM